jgi:2-polyprenyl-6-methoxyphenol hydroxylase-like FAD-dependent oxidoreductase
MKAIVVGGGIGGLSAAIALRQAGLDVSVYEQAPEAREVGAGISIWGNAVRALRKIGAADGVVAAGETMRHGELRDRRGRVLSRSDVGEADSRLGAPSLLLHRADLLAALHAHLPQGVVRFGRAFTGMDIDAKQVSARFDDAAGGTDEAIADVLIGADGLNSAVRAAVHGPEEPRYSGYTCWRGVVAFPYERWPPGYLCEVWGPGKRFGLTRIGAGRIYWFATLNAPPGGLDADARATVRGLFAGWFDPIPAVIEATDPAAVLRNDICDRPPSREPSRGGRAGSRCWGTLRTRPRRTWARARAWRSRTRWSWRGGWERRRAARTWRWCCAPTSASAERGRRW